MATPFARRTESDVCATARALLAGRGRSHAPAEVALFAGRARPCRTERRSLAPRWPRAFRFTPPSPSQHVSAFALANLFFPLFQHYTPLAQVTLCGDFLSPSILSGMDQV